MNLLYSYLKTSKNTVLFYYTLSLSIRNAHIRTTLIKNDPFAKMSNPGKEILMRCFDITNRRDSYWGHSSSRSQMEIQVRCRSCHHNRCPGRISSCQHSRHHCRNLLPLPHIAGNWCSNLVLHFHQRSCWGHSSNRR